MRFKDRSEAGKKLALALEKYRDQPAIVYGLPRGGVVWRGNRPGLAPTVGSDHSS